jgi:hypothetical protein
LRFEIIIIQIIFCQADDGGGLVVIKVLDIEDHVIGDFIDKDESLDWVLFKIPLLDHGFVSPPTVTMEIVQTLKVHIFGYPDVGDLSFGTSSSSSSSSSENKNSQYPSGACIQAEISQIRRGHFLLNTNSIQRLSGGAVVCDQSGAILGKICGQWQGIRRLQ